MVNLFNMFITYGDTFLPTSNSYDELYYEIVRMHQVFDNLYCMGMWQQDVAVDKKSSIMIVDDVELVVLLVGKVSNFELYFEGLWKVLQTYFFPVLRVSTNTGQWKEAASKVTHALVNVRYAHTRTHTLWCLPSGGQSC